MQTLKLTVIAKGGKWIAATAIACLVVVLYPASAKADLTITTTTTTPTGQPYANRNFMDSVIYIQGKKARVKSDFQDMIIDLDAGKIITITDAEKSYTEEPYNPAHAEAIMQNGPGGGVPYFPNLQVKTVDTGQTSTLSGHKVRHYVVTAQMNPQPNGRTMSTHSDILAAQDFSSNDVAAYDAFTAGAPLANDVKGIPIQATTTVSEGPNEASNFIQTSSVSTAPIPDSMFTIPGDYTRDMAVGN